MMCLLAKLVVTMLSVPEEVVGSIPAQGEICVLERDLRFPVLSVYYVLKFYLYRLLSVRPQHGFVLNMFHILLLCILILSKMLLFTNFYFSYEREWNCCIILGFYKQYFMH